MTTETEYAVRFPGKRGIEVVPSEEFGLRLVKNDPERVLLRRTVTPWEQVYPPRQTTPGGTA